MKYFCYRRHDEFPVQLAYTIRYIGTVESAEELSKFVLDELPEADISFCESGTYCFEEDGRKISVAPGDFLVLSPGKHFESYSDMEFFKRFFLS